MTREQFLDLVRQPATASSLTGNTLSDLIDQFPYCQPLRILQLRSLHDSESIHYQQQLKITAAYAPDRTRLFTLLHDKEKKKEPVITAIHSVSEETKWETPAVSEIQNEQAEETKAVREPSYEFSSTELNTSSETEPSMISFDEIMEDENHNASAISSLIEEKADTNEEEEISPQKIIEQRLRELNLWKEGSPASQKLVINVPPIHEEETENLISSPAEIKEEIEFAATETKDEELINEENVSAVIDVSSYSIEEITGKPEKEEIVASIEKVNISEVEQEEEIDPIELLIAENIVETKIASANYFEELQIDEKQAFVADTIEDSKPEILTEEKEEIVGKTEIARVEIKNEEIRKEEIHNIVYSESDKKEVHSFSQWLHSKKNDDHEEIHLKKEEESSTNSIEPVAEKLNTETEKQDEIPSFHIRKAIEQNVQEASTGSEEKQETEEAKETFSFQPKEIIKENITEVKSSITEEKPRTLNNTAKVIYVKESKNEESSTIENVSPFVNIPAEKVPVIKSVSFSLSESLSKEEEPAIDSAKILSEEERKARSQQIATAPIPEIPKTKADTNQLIDKFIKQDPRITPAKSTFYSPANMAKKSVQEPDDLVSETLARIYAQQGNLPRAISFYEKLALKFPEKSRYFAALVEELNNKLNS